MNAELVIPVQPLPTEYIGRHRMEADAEEAHRTWVSQLASIAGRAALALGLASGTNICGAGTDKEGFREIACFHINV